MRPATYVPFKVQPYKSLSDPLRTMSDNDSSLSLPSGPGPAITSGISNLTVDKWESSVKASEANARASETAARVDIGINERQRLKEQFEKDTKLKLNEMDQTYENSMKEVEIFQEMQLRNFENLIKQMENIPKDLSKAAKSKMKEETLNQLKDQKNERDITYNSNVEAMKNMVARKQTNNVKMADLVDKVDHFEVYKKRDLENYSVEIGLVTAKQELSKIEEDLSHTLSTTALQEDAISTFLGIIVGLIDATMPNQEKIKYLSSQLESFVEQIRQASTLTISDYFTDAGMEKYIKILADEDLLVMNDIKCRDENEYKDLIEMIEDALKEQHEAWENEKKECELNNKKFDKIEPKGKIGLKDLRFFKKVCLQPESWQAEEAAKLKATKSKLDEVAEPLANFFNKIGVTMKEVQQILDFSNARASTSSTTSALTQVQKQAIDWVKTQKTPAPVAVTEAGGNTLKALYPAESEIPIEDEKNDTSVTTTKSKDTDSSSSNTKNMQEQFGAIIVSGTEESENAKIDYLKRFDSNGQSGFIENGELVKAALLKVYNISESMISEFEGSAFKNYGLILVKGIERTCMEIVRNMGQIRQSLVLAHCILNLKPANIEGDSKKLWDAVNNGVTNIFNNALEMSKISAQFFEFFLKFEDSFQYYIACSKTKKIATSNALKTGCEHLEKDVRDFAGVSDTFGENANKLGQNAMECVNMCVKNTMAAEKATDSEIFEEKKKLREEKLAIYLSKKNLFDAKELEMNSRFVRYLRQKSELEVQIKIHEFDVRSLQKEMDFEKSMINQIDQAISDLMRMKI